MSGWRGKRGINDDFFTMSEYSSPSNSVIAQFYSTVEGIPLHRIYIRKSNEVNYRLLTSSLEGIDCLSFVVSQNLPVIFVNSHELFTIHKGKLEYTGKWHLLQEFNLETGESRVVLSEKNSVNNHLTDRRIWISSIEGYDAVTNDLFVQVAIEKEFNQNHIKVEYWLSKIDRDTGKIELISIFPDVFF